MLRVSRQTQIALFILMECAKSPDGLMQTVNVAEAAGTTKDHAAQIVNLLATHGLLHTRRGRNGGFSLARKADSITMGDVLRVTENDLPVAAAARRETEVQDKALGAVQLALDGAFAFYINLLNRMTICDLAGNRLPECPGGQFISIGLPCPYAAEADICETGCHSVH